MKHGFSFTNEYYQTFNSASKLVLEIQFDKVYTYAYIYRLKRTICKLIPYGLQNKKNIY